MKKFMTLSTLSITCFGQAEAKKIFCSGMDEQGIKTRLESNEEDFCEFKKGEKIKVKLSIQGNILKSTETPPSTVEIQKGFFLKMSKNGPVASWDGNEYKPLAELISGEVSAKIQGESSADLVVIGLNVDQQNNITNSK